MPAIDLPARDGTTVAPLHAGRLAAARLAAARLAPPAGARGDTAHAKPADQARLEQTDGGIAGTARTGLRVVHIRRTGDMRVSPDRLAVRLGEIAWTGNRAGSFDVACLIAGRHPAGRVGKVTVLPAATRTAGPTPPPTAIPQGPNP